MKNPTTLSTVASFLLVGNCFGQERPKITSVSHLSVYTSDAAKAEQFYVHDLGALKQPDPQILRVCATTSMQSSL
jgi:hypothetical protein